MAQKLQDELSINSSMEEKHDTLCKALPSLRMELEEAKRERVRTTPKLGGVTRWIADKFTCIEYISTELPTMVNL